MNKPSTTKSLPVRLLKAHFAILSHPLKSLILLIALALFMIPDKASAQTYCSPISNTNGSIYYISSVTTTGGTTNISNTTTASVNGFGNYTTMAVTVLSNGTFTLTSNSDNLFTYKWAVWVDWNHDGDFDDTGENVYSFLSTTGVSTITTPVSVPAAALSGNTRMRVRILRDWATDLLTPCTDNLYGEAEDYTVTVISSACSGTPNAGTANAAATTLACNTTTTLSLTGNTTGSGINYQWQYNTTGTWVNFGTNSATQTTPPLTLPTQFRAVITCANSALNANSAPVTVGVTPFPVNIGNDTTICPGIAYTLNAGNPGSTYAWNTGATTGSISTNAAGTYAVLVTMANGCKGWDTIHITPGIVPVNNLPVTTNLCSGETAVLNAGNTGSSFLWTPGNATTQTINATDAGNYTVKVKSSTGCILNSSTKLVIRPLPVAHLGNDTSICDGAQITLDAGNPGYAYAWNTGASSQTIDITDSGTYSVTTTTPYDCTLEEDRHIAFLPSPRAEGFNFIPLFYEEMGKVRFSPLNPTNVNSYKWDFGDGTATSTQMNPEHHYASGGEYLVTLSVFNGCGDFDISLPIHVDLTTGIVQAGIIAAEVMVYPNPSRDYIRIENKAAGLDMQQVSVFNVLGAQVYQQQADGAKSHQMSVTGLASGLYSIRILTDKGFVIRKFEVLR